MDYSHLLATILAGVLRLPLERPVHPHRTVSLLTNLISMVLYVALESD